MWNVFYRASLCYTCFCQVFAAHQVLKILKKRYVFNLGKRFISLDISWKISLHHFIISLWKYLYLNSSFIAISAEFCLWSFICCKLRTKYRNSTERPHWKNRNEPFLFIIRDASELAKLYYIQTLHFLVSPKKNPHGENFFL